MRTFSGSRQAAQTWPEAVSCSARCMCICQLCPLSFPQQVIDTILASTTRLVANKKAWADPEKRRKIEDVALLLQVGMGAGEEQRCSRAAWGRRHGRRRCDSSHIWSTLQLLWWKERDEAVWCPTHFPVAPPFPCLGAGRDCWARQGWAQVQHRHGQTCRGERWCTQNIHVHLHRRGTCPAAQRAASLVSLHPVEPHPPTCPLLCFPSCCSSPPACLRSRAPRCRS